MIIKEDPKAIIFDFDGTLYDCSYFALHLVLGAPLDAFRMKAERIARYVLRGKDFGDSQHFREAFFAEMAKHTHKDAIKCEQWYDSFYTSHTIKILKKHYRVRHGLMITMQALRDKGLKIAVLSDYCHIKDRMKAIGLSESFCDVIASTMEMGCLKPCKRAFDTVANLLEVPAEECLVVGDRVSTDGMGALSAGMSFVHIGNVTLGTTISWGDFCRAVLHKG